MLRAFRDGAPGVLIHGMGALGKSSVAARVANRTALKPVVVFDRYDALAIFDEVLAALPACEQRARKEAWRESVKEDAAVLAGALEDWLEGPFHDAPILLIVDDLEQALETPRPGDAATGVAPDYGDALGAVLTVFARAPTNRRCSTGRRRRHRAIPGCRRC
ncbi:MAG: AAA family ATPase [Alphaproteobacteria bacterium]|nr:AAA family ATPase [Alphaproteobacteria bacterium]